MARIRTIKPEFYRHELLQELERDNPGLYPMLVFQALWGHCDKQGVFEWRPKHLALDILPFLWQGSIGEALGKCLGKLEENGLIKRLVFEGKEYGFVPSFAEHQRLGGKESQDRSRFPQPSEMSEICTGEALGKHRGSNGEAMGIAGREGKGRGRERNNNQSSIGGGTAKTARESSPPPEAAEGVVVERREAEIEAEVGRVKGLHLHTCGLNTLPPLAIVREILQRGIPVSQIDDVYQAHGGDIPKYRQRNIVEQLTALRDHGQRSPPEGRRGRGGGLSGVELRQQATFAAARAFAEGGHDGS